MQLNFPCEVTILIAAPLTRTEFEERVAVSDWLGKLQDPDASQERLAQDLDDYWTNDYLPFVVEPFQELIGIAVPLGARIHIGSALASLRGATERGGIVVLFAHWKGAEIKYDDLNQAGDIGAFARAAAGRPSALARWLSSRLNSGSLVDILNEALEAPLPAGNPGSGVGAVLQSEGTRAANRRVEMESIFGTLLRPGNRLELFDGMHSKEAVEREIAPDFAGVLDLPVCHSVILADYLDRKRRHRMRTVQFPKPLKFDWAAKCVGGTLQLLDSGNFGYQEARIQVKTLIDAAIRRTAKAG